MLPISVIIPTRNCRDRLPNHLSSMKVWTTHVRELIVVDSYSSDGTIEFLRDELNHPNIHFFNHPPGLYESWNFGIGKTTMPYIYISTVGDTISLEGLKHLLKFIQLFDSDLLISPPKFESNGTFESKITPWPIHDILDFLQINEPTSIPSETLIYYILFYRDFGIQGSSASNIYKSSTLMKYPFPTTYGAAGDSAWFIKNIYNIATSVTPEYISTYLYHAKDWDLVTDTEGRAQEMKNRRIAFRKLIGETISERFQQSTIRNLGPNPELLECYRRTEKFLKNKELWSDYKKNFGAFRYFFPQALRAKFIRDRLKKHYKRLSCLAAKRSFVSAKNKAKTGSALQESSCLTT